MPSKQVKGTVTDCDHEQEDPEILLEMKDKVDALINTKDLGGRNPEFVDTRFSAHEGGL